MYMWWFKLKPEQTFGNASSFKPRLMPWLTHAQGLRLIFGWLDMLASDVMSMFVAKIIHLCSRKRPIDCFGRESSLKGRHELDRPDLVLTSPSLVMQAVRRVALPCPRRFCDPIPAARRRISGRYCANKAVSWRPGA
jgi:hypothetical protein